GAAGMTERMSWHKGKKELTEESTGEGKHGRKKRERLFKKRFSRLSLFSGAGAEFVTSVCAGCSPQGRSPPAEDKRRCWHRRGWQRQEEPCSLPQLGAPRRSGRMCPSCEILLCRPCGTLHSQRAFIAHSLLDHYDSAGMFGNSFNLSFS
uniref:DUF4637 domain-containing protein n=1 Tax=Serinus canaria TaxID=9135 RepID=A0A8C9NUJ3_SERCA